MIEISRTDSVVADETDIYKRNAARERARREQRHRARQERVRELYRELGNLEREDRNDENSPLGWERFSPAVPNRRAPPRSQGYSENLPDSRYFPRFPARPSSPLSGYRANERAKNRRNNPAVSIGVKLPNGEVMDWRVDSSGSDTEWSEVENGRRNLDMPIKDIRRPQRPDGIYRSRPDGTMKDMEDPYSHSRRAGPQYMKDKADRDQEAADPFEMGRKAEAELRRVRERLEALREQELGRGIGRAERREPRDKRAPVNLADELEALRQTEALWRDEERARAQLMAERERSWLKELIRLTERLRQEYAPWQEERLRGLNPHIYMQEKVYPDGEDEDLQSLRRREQELLAEVEYWEAKARPRATRELESVRPRSWVPPPMPQTLPRIHPRESTIEETFGNRAGYSGLHGSPAFGRAYGPPVSPSPKSWMRLHSSI